MLPALDRVGVLQELRSAVQDGTPPEVSAADNLRTFAAVLAIARSDRRAAAGRAVKLGLFLALFHDRPLGEALAAARAAGCEAVEISTTGPHGGEDLAAAAAAHGLEISALSCHANPLHPHHEIAARADRDFRDTVRRAASAGVPTVITFAGCPGDSETSQRPNWVTCSWPDDYPQTLDVAVERAGAAVLGGARPSSRASTASASPSSRIPASSSTTRRRCCGCARPPVTRSACNFDPSHFFWQQIDPLASARALAGAIFHVHAKDTGFYPAPDRGRRRARDEARPGRAGLDLPDGRRRARRRLVAQPVGALRDAGYDGALSIEHEDHRCSRPTRGSARAVATLRAALD